MTSQFEKHLGAVCGLPLGITDTCGPSAMLNFLGDVPPLEEVLRVPKAHVHLYDKSPLPGRKVGHVNFTGRDRDEVAATLVRLEALAKGLTLATAGSGGSPFPRSRDPERPSETLWRHPA